METKQNAVKTTKKIRIHSRAYPLKLALGFIVLVGVFVFSCVYLDLDFVKLFGRFSNVGEVMGRMMHLDVSMIPEILLQLLVSVALAVLSLILAAVISFFLAAFAALNLCPVKGLSGILKGAVAVIRAVPSMVWILMAVASVGFGNSGALLGLTIMGVGFLTKAFCAVFEENGMGRVEAMRSVGARWINVLIQGVANDALPGLLTWVALTLETNLAASISLGVLGISGVGYLLNKQIMKFNYPGISTILLIIFLFLVCVEFLLVKGKERIHGN